MIQFVSQRPGESSKITSMSVTKSETGQYVIKFEGDVTEIFPGRLEVDIDDNWMMFRGNYKEGYRLNTSTNGSGRLQITAPDDTHKAALEQFVGLETSGIGYNRESHMFGVKLKADRATEIKIPSTPEEWNAFIDKCMRGEFNAK